MTKENNDSRILELKKQIKEKKKDLSTNKARFSPETNCILELEDNKYNLNVLEEKNLILLMLKLNLYNMSADSLKIPHVEISGYCVDLWISDIKCKLAVMEMRKEETDLKRMESKLDKMLSDDKKTELELDEIASLLK